MNMNLNIICLISIIIVLIVIFFCNSNESFKISIENITLKKNPLINIKVNEDLKNIIYQKFEEYIFTIIDKDATFVNELNTLIPALPNLREKIKDKDINKIKSTYYKNLSFNQIKRILKLINEYIDICDILIDNYYKNVSVDKKELDIYYKYINDFYSKSCEINNFNKNIKNRTYWIIDPLLDFVNINSNSSIMTCT
jgi:hypothetical protein